MIRFHKDGSRFFGDEESDSPEFVWAWYETKQFWIPKRMSRYFPTIESLLTFAAEHGTIAVRATAGTEEGEAGPDYTPEGYEDLPHLGMPWVHTNCPGEGTPWWWKARGEK